MCVMAVGYLDLLQRELRDTVIHPFATAADLALHPGTEGQIASTEGSFYIWTAGAWKRVLSESDISLIEAALSRTATVFTVVIPASIATAPGSFQVNHGFQVQPVVEVTGPGGSVIGLQVQHNSPTQGSATVLWDTALPGATTVTCVGQAATTPVGARRR